MGDNDRRRAGDDTRQRIDRLAEGWDVGPAPSPEPEPAPVAAPPPIPERAKAGSRPPPIPPRPQRNTAPPPPPPPPAVPPAAPPAAPPRPVVIEREDPTDADPRDDATRVDPRGDATVMAQAERAARVTGATLPVRASFRRRDGWTGDLRYVVTVLFRSAAARRELARLEAALETHKRDRAALLITLGAEGVGDPALTGDALDAARTQLAELEDERAARAGDAAAADAEAEAIARAEKAAIAREQGAISALEAEQTELTARLAPLDKEAGAIRRRGDALRATLARQDDALRTVEAKVEAMRGKAERGAVEAELATLRADRATVAKDEPALAAQLDELTPRIAALEAERAGVVERLTEARNAIERAKARAADELEAVAAQRKVLARDVLDVERRRDRALATVGERLAVDRPPSLSGTLARLDEADLEAGEAQRRAIELREMLATIDRRALARGIAVAVVALAALGAIGFWVVTR